MKTLNRQTGNLGEDIATKALIEKGFEIVERNFSNRFGEIDIIAKDKGVLVFVEVKSKTGIVYGRPEDMITPSKLSKIRHMGMLYMQGKNLLCRIDVVAIIFSSHNEVVSLTHYENVCL